jgi:hypothetical protein
MALRRRRPDDVADADVHLKSRAKTAAANPHRDSDSGVLVLGPDGLEAEGADIEHETVRFDLGCEDRLDAVADGLLASFSSVEQVEVTSRAVGLTGPDTEQHRPFEDELVTDRRDAEAIQKPLGGVNGDERLVVVSGLPGAGEQPRKDRGREVPLRPVSHAMASM